MIAVFATTTELMGIHFSPLKEFKLIRSIKDVRGVRFTGFLAFSDYSVKDSVEKREAFEYIRMRQPELFK